MSAVGEVDHPDDGDDGDNDDKYDGILGLETLVVIIKKSFEFSLLLATYLSFRGSRKKCLPKENFHPLLGYDVHVSLEA